MMSAEVQNSQIDESCHDTVRILYFNHFINIILYQNQDNNEEPADHEMIHLNTEAESEEDNANQANQPDETNETNETNDYVDDGLSKINLNEDGSNEGGDEAVDDEEDDEDDDDDDDDEDVQVTIGDLKGGSLYSYGSTPMNLNISKRGPGFGGAQSSSAVRPKQGIDIDAAGNINGVSIYEFNLDSLEEKPWRKPGADITDYFNYGFNEDTWKLYCEKQKKLRDGNNPNAQTGVISKINSGITTTGKIDQPIPIASVNENSKYAGMGVTKKAGPPPGRKQSGTIDVIGGGTPTTPSLLPSRRPPETKENFIQVIGNRPPVPPGPPPPGMPGIPGMGFPPMSMPPPFGFPPPDFPPGMPPPGMPMLAPNGQPLAFPPGDFPPMRFPHPPMMPHPDFEEHADNYQDGRHDDRSQSQEHEREREKEHERDYHRSRGFNRDYREDERPFRKTHYRDHYDRDHHHREHERDDREYDHHERSREREYEKERERRSHRDRDRDKDKDKTDSHSRDSRDSRESRRRHEYDDDHRSSSKHKHSKRSKRDKDDDTESKH